MSVWQTKQMSPQLLQGFHNYRFVWDLSSVEFAIDGNWSSQITANVPQAPGVLSLSLWSDGNQNYSSGPPMSTATLTVSHSWVFYNATGVSMPCKETNVPCTGSQIVGMSYIQHLTHFSFPARHHICLTNANLSSVDIRLFASALAQCNSCTQAGDGNSFCFALLVMALSWL
jgi:hypothetical protein